jgi:hypothetical protein
VISAVFPSSENKSFVVMVIPLQRNQDGKKN